MARVRIQVGDRVRWSYLGKQGDTGVVLRVTPKQLSGGSAAIVRVRWDSNGHVGSVEDRVLQVIKPALGVAPALVQDQLIFIYMPGCPTCATVKPLIAQFRKAHPDVVVKPLDITQVEWKARRWSPSYTPTLVHLDRHRRVHIFDGVPASDGGRLITNDMVAKWLSMRF